MTIFIVLIGAALLSGTMTLSALPAYEHLKSDLLHNSQGKLLICQVKHRQRELQHFEKISGWKQVSKRCGSNCTDKLHNVKPR